MAMSTTIVLALVVVLSTSGSAMGQEDRPTPGMNVATVSPQQQGPTDRAELKAFMDKELGKEMKKHHIAGAAVSVVKDGKLFFAKGYGNADLKSGIPVDPERTTFRIGSVTKLFTSTLDPQPDQIKHPEEWARFVGSTPYLVDHIFGAIGGAVLAIIGVYALGAYLSRSQAGRLGLVAMVMTVVGQSLGLVIGGVSTFASDAIGRAYLASPKDVMQVEFSVAMSAIFGLAILLMFVGSVLLGAAVWRSGTLARWTGAIWAASALVFYLLGAVAGILNTGSSLPTQPVGGLLKAASGAWIAWSVMRQPSAEAVRIQAQPRVP